MSLRSTPIQEISDPKAKLSTEQVQHALGELFNWKVTDKGLLQREFKFKNFARAMKWAHAIGTLADNLNHHPDLEVGWGYVRVSFSTHSVGGLTTNDTASAAHVDALFDSLAMTEA